MDPTSMTIKFLFAAFALAVSTTVPPSAGDLVQAPDVALAMDDECLAGKADPRCAESALQRRAQKMQARVKKHADRALHAQADNASSLAGGPFQSSCKADTMGSCVFMGCAETRGNAVKCERGRCLCHIGYCAVKGACVRNGACSTVTGGTCNIMGCAESRGEVECRGGQCICKKGYCADSAGRCFDPNAKDEEEEEEEDDDEDEY